jgi:hypothetical protein
MQPATRSEFLKWHCEQKNKLFDLQKELEDYCISDSDILMKSCLTYRDIFLEVTKTSRIENDNGIDHFEQCLTKASVYNQRTLIQSIIILALYTVSYFHLKIFYFRYYRVDTIIN